MVNNNAAALLLAALALAQGKEIVLSRGELVEIGDGFRIPDLLASTGARLREVGTTNRTTVGDYAAAIGPDTGFVLKVHPSNFLVTGFTASGGRRAGRRWACPLVVDIGSGLLRPHPLLPDEPDAATALRGRRHPRHRQRRQAARRTPGRPAARRRGPRGTAATPSGRAGDAGGQAHAGGPGRDLAWT